VDDDLYLYTRCRKKYENVLTKSYYCIRMFMAPSSTPCSHCHRKYEYLMGYRNRKYPVTESTTK